MSHTGSEETDLVSSSIEHNLSNRELAANQVKLLEKDTNFNQINSKSMDFIGTLEHIVHQLNISDEVENSIRYTAPTRIAKLRPKTKHVQREGKQASKMQNHWVNYMWVIAEAVLQKL